MSFSVKPAPNYSATIYADIKRECPGVFMVLLRAKNHNIVVYEAKITNGVLNRENPVDVYWLDIDEAYRKPRRAQGIQHDRTEMSPWEYSTIFGVTWEFVNDKELLLNFVVEQHPIRIVIDDLGAKMFTSYQGKQYWVRSVYVAANDQKPNLFHLRSNVQELSFSGYNYTTKKLETVYVIRNGV